MNRPDVANILALLAAAWPNHDVSQETAGVWMDALNDLNDPEIALATARRIIRESRWFPSIAQYRNEYAALAQGKASKHASHRGLPNGHMNAPPRAELLEAARSLLDDMRSKHHDHRGPNPCPICGGIAPKERR